MPTLPSVPLHPGYDLSLVLVSYLIAVGASYSALDMAERVAVSTGRARRSWLLAGAATMGAGIWSMHFTGMLAFRFPVPTSNTYDVVLTVLSLVIAVLASLLALALAGRQRLGGAQLVGGGTILGLGIAAMHYTGMAAMRGPCVVAYSVVPFMASIGIAISAAMTALWLAFRLRGESDKDWSWRKFGSAGVMGFAIAGMHYTGMASGRYVPMCTPEAEPAGLIGVSGLGGAAIAFGTLVVIALALNSAYRERLRWQQDLMKDRFLGVLSHELRTPINAIMGFGSILEDGVLGEMPERQREAVRRILDGADTLLRLVDDLLDMSRIQAGKLVHAPRPMDLAAACQRVVEALGSLAEQKRLDLTLELPDALPEVFADPQRIEQVLVNLVGNAIKFTPPGGVVAIRAEQTGIWLRCEVMDTGKGIDRRDHPRLFKPFGQLDMSTTRPAGGTGLGLSISKALVEAHGGQIGLESAPGQGSTFWFTLPVLQAVTVPHRSPAPTARPS
jgi:signal transduction histidine kinase